MEVRPGESVFAAAEVACRLRKEAATPQELTWLPVEGCSFTPDGRYASVRRGEDRTEFLDLVECRVFEASGVLVANDLRSADGARLLAFQDAPKSLRLATVEGETVTTIAAGGHVHSLQKSSDGRRFLFRNDLDQVHVWTVEGRQLALYDKWLGSPLLFAPAGDRILACEEKGARLLHVGAGEATDLSQSGEVTAANYSPDGSMLVTWTPASFTLRVWSREGVLLASHRADGMQIYSCGFLPDGSAVYAVDATNSCYHALTEDPSRILLWPVDGEPAQELHGHAGVILAHAVSPDSRLLAAAGTEGVITVWDLQTGVSTSLRGHDNMVTSLDISSDGHMLLSGSLDGTCRVWWLDNERLKELARERAVRDFTGEERSRYRALLSD